MFYLLCQFHFFNPGSPQGGRGSDRTMAPRLGSLTGERETHVCIAKSRGKVLQTGATVRFSPSGVGSGEGALPLRGRIHSGLKSPNVVRRLSDATKSA